MNAPMAAEKVSILVGEALVTIPAELAARAYLERMLEQSRPAPLTLTADRLLLPAIGSPWRDGEYAGLTIFENLPHHLVLLPGEREPGSYEPASKWAEERRAMLPSRFDGLVLVTNLKDRFKSDGYYWLSDPVAGYPDYAWYQYIGNGNQNWYHRRSNYFSAVAIRRYPIE